MTSRIFTAIFICITGLWSSAQTTAPVAAAWQRMMQSEQLDYASAGICVIDAATGKIVFADNEKIGLAPASTTKTLTSIAAFDALGEKFQYHTSIWTLGNIENGVLHGDLVIEGSGDPTMGSWRYSTTKNDAQLEQIAAALLSKGIKSIDGNMVVYNSHYDINPVPPYWPYGDIGNYYGAGIYPLNWNENQFDLHFKTGGSVGAATTINGKKPAILPLEQMLNEVTTGAAGIGDQSIIYTAPYSNTMLVQGKLPANQRSFTVSGAVPDGEKFMMLQLANALKNKGIAWNGKLVGSADQRMTNVHRPDITKAALLMQLSSPSLDTMVYWFMKKSINLYGEAFTRTIGFTQKQSGTTEDGIEWMENHFKTIGLDIKGMHLGDGSGLSPTNRIAPLFLCQALRYAKGRPWYAAYIHAFPEYNGMTLKSGTIHRVKCFAGYHGKYIVAIMVNNYNGSSSALIQKMYAVLNTLK